MPVIDHHNVLFGVLLADKQLDLMISVLLILAKFFIQKAKFIKIQPSFTHYYNEFQLYIKSPKLMNSKGAKDLCRLLKKKNEGPGNNCLSISVTFYLL